MNHSLSGPFVCIEKEQSYQYLISKILASEVLICIINEDNCTCIVAMVLRENNIGDLLRKILKNRGFGIASLVLKTT